MSEIPEGYIAALARNKPAQVSHLYKGSFHEPGNPMCRNGWTNPGLQEYSILRGNIGAKGICKTCLKRALAGKEGISWEERFGNESR